MEFLPAGAALEPAFFLFWGCSPGDGLGLPVGSSGDFDMSPFYKHTLGFPAMFFKDTSSKASLATSARRFNTDTDTKGLLFTHPISRSRSRRQDPVRGTSRSFARGTGTAGGYHRCVGPRCIRIGGRRTSGPIALGFAPSRPVRVAPRRLERRRFREQPGQTVRTGTGMPAIFTLTEPRWLRLVK